MSMSVKIIFFLIIILGVFIYGFSRYPAALKIFTGHATSTFSFFGPFTGTSSTISFPFSWPSWNPNFSRDRFRNPSGPSFGLPGSEEYNYPIPRGFTRAQISPYYQKVKMSAVSSYFSFGPQAQLQLAVYLPPRESVDITGWHIKGNRGDIVIPQAVNIYSWTGLAPDADIIVSGQSSVNIYGGASPIARNLRLNKCTGYLNNTEVFNPLLPQNCPAPYNRYDIVKLPGFCQSYILSLGACQLPDTKFYNALPATSEGDVCRDFLNTITVKSCYDNHAGDRDFLSNTWLVWSTGNFVDPQHDQLNLFDKSELLVDQYTY